MPPQTTTAEHPDAPRSDNVDPTEVGKFDALAEEWWDPNGKMRPLHQIGPARLAFIRRQAEMHLASANRPTTRRTPLAGLSLLDVGCGGGLIAEPLARLGANVTAIDPAAETVAAAAAHARAQGLDIDYRADRVETLAEADETFDIVTCLEVVEHVPDVSAFVRTLSQVVRPGGLLIVSTIDRTAKSFALAIVGAEYVLRWLPRGTHQWDRFVRPDELAAHFDAAGLSTPTFEGLVFDPLRNAWSLSEDTDVNYLAAAARPEAF